MAFRHLWLRAETKIGERRSPLTPTQAGRLVEAGYKLTVERSELRIFEDGDYASLGCEMVEEGTWPNAPLEAAILGLKELPEATFPLVHTHIYFAHCFKEQAGWNDIMARFAAGGGEVLDLEFLVDEAGKRVAAFGYWAGFVGAAVAVDLHCHRMHKGDDTPYGPLEPYPSRESWIGELQQSLSTSKGVTPRMIIIGALGRCGRGATELADALGLDVTAWDMAETAVGGPFPELLEHELFVNCVYLKGSIPPFLTAEGIDGSRKLAVISDVSCDPQSPYNPIPVYKDSTTFKSPKIRVRSAAENSPALDVIAIDHLPGLLPREASESYSQDLFEHVACLNSGSPVWTRARQKYQEVLATLSL